MARGRAAAPAMGPYLSGVMGGGNTPGSAAGGFPKPIGKSHSVQNLGNLAGRRTAGISKGAHGEEQQLAHAFDHYGKPRASRLKEPL